MIEKTTGGAAEHFVYDGAQRALTLDDAGTLARRTSWSPGVDQLLVDEVFSGGMVDDTLWAATDYLGSVNQLVDNGGTVVEHREYDAFGAIDQVFDETGAAQTSADMRSDIGFAGRQWDDDASLYYNRARWYEPESGRFISEDPAEDGSNWYAYAGNNPVNFVDPSGLAVQSPLDSLRGPLSFPTGSNNLASAANNCQVNQYQNQFDTFSQQRSNLNTQLATAQQSLANRSFYEVFDSRSDRNQIASIKNQLSDVVGQQSVARDNLFSAQRTALNGDTLQTFTYQTTDRFSVGGAALSGLGTGGKAVVNAAASSATLGFYDGPLQVTQQDIDNGYNTSRLIAGLSTELAVGLATGGASRFGRAGKAALAFDTASNVVGVGRGAIDVAQNGLTFGNSLQIIGGGAGLGGNALGFREALIRNRIDDFVSGLPSRSTPTNSNADLFEVRQTGSLNYTVNGGGATVNIDGFSYRHRAITEAKFVGNPARSPYVLSSAFPNDLRQRFIIPKLSNEFSRLNRVISDPSTPFKSLRVITNNSDAQSFFGQLTKVGIPATVIRRK